jgi:hypothetical protein
MSGITFSGLNSRAVLLIAKVLVELQNVPGIIGI